MALKALMLHKNIDAKKAEMKKLEERSEEFETRSAELEASINEAETEEERAACEEEVEEFETEQAEHENKRQGLQKEIEELEAALDEEERSKKINEPKPIEEIRKEPAPMADNMKEIREMERRAFADYIRGIQTREAYDMTQGNNGVVVPKTIADEIITKIKEICPIFEKATRYPVKGTLEVPYYPYSTDHVISAGYANEMQALEASSGDFGAVELTGYLAGAFAKISKKLVNNMDLDVIDFVVEQMAEAFKSFYERECLKGTTGKADGLLKGITATVTGTYKSVCGRRPVALQMKVPTAYQQDASGMRPTTLKNQAQR